jgi:acyl-CoA hydrolase
MPDTIMRKIAEYFPRKAIYLPGGTGEITSLADTVAADPELIAGTKIISCLIPGINNFDYGAVHPDARLTTFFGSPALRKSAANGSLRIVPICYSEIARYLAATHVDIAVAQVAPPDQYGRCSLGISGDFTPIIWPRAAVRVLVVNRRMPALPRAPQLAAGDANLIVDIDERLPAVG